MNIPDRIADEEILGRCVTSRKEADRAKHKRGIAKLLTPRSGTVSVDRLSLAPDAFAVANGERVATARQEGLKKAGAASVADIAFCGWITVTAQAVHQVGGKCRASPTTTPWRNPYHADIVAPAEHDPLDSVPWVQRLARRALWKERPTEIATSSSSSGRLP